MRKVMGLVPLLILSQASCISVGYSGRSGWFIWPGGLGLLILVVFVVWLLRRR